MVNHGSLATTTRDPRTELSRTIWQWLSGRGILAVSGALLVLLFLCASFVQQMPGQVAADPAAATRWLLTVSETYGVFGNSLRALGLFDVLHHPLLQLLLAVIAIVLLVQLGNTLTALWRFWQIRQAFDEPVTAAGEPLPLPHAQPLYRLRQAAAQSPQALSTQLRQELPSQFEEITTVTLHTAPYVPPAEEALMPQADAGADASPTPQPVVDEVRLLASHHRRLWIWLRPLLLLGLLIALVAVWLILQAGWAVTPPWLAPGDEYRATTQRVALAYTLAEEKRSLIPMLSVEIAEIAHELPLGESRQLHWGQIRIEANSGPPALLIRSTDAAIALSRPGQTQRTADLGLIFPSLGSEDSVVVENSVGLRVVRVSRSPTTEQGSANANNGSESPLAGAPQEHFLVEVYQSDEAKPVQTLYVSQQMSTTISINGTAREIWLIPLPSMAAAVRYQPGIWLLWVALGLVMLGVVGFAYQPAFLVVQIAPWPTERAVVVAQSDVATALDRIRLSLK